ncbi:hypothetical protein PC118_g16459 [Phytophthora cactorum]|uniref:Uncharacterized protein n=1 Tax=Phytophthora cactorum TaxID=29920 RepID=A0A8T1FGL7_9STRA|nr:hypothetical protein PC118_g16459 [Phytophthora cactorum]
MACCKTLTEVKNIIWHGCFTLDLPQMRAWIGADLAALPQTSGGMAVPDLRTELIAMTGSTVARWALLGTHGPHIVQIRDVHHWCGDDRGRLECMMLFPHNRRARLPLEQVQQYLTVLNYKAVLHTGNLWVLV